MTDITAKNYLGNICCQNGFHYRRNGCRNCRHDGCQCRHSGCHYRHNGCYKYRHSGYIELEIGCPTVIADAATPLLRMQHCRHNRCTGQHSNRKYAFNHGAFCVRRENANPFLIFSNYRDTSTRVDPPTARGRITFTPSSQGKLAQEFDVNQCKNIAKFTFECKRIQNFRFHYIATLSTRTRLSNFKKFEQFEVDFDREMNILIGDNEAGKSSILAALDFALSGSRSKVESAGIESLINIDSIIKFFSGGARSINRLPIMCVEVYLSDQGNPDLNGKNNSLGKECDGLRMTCAPMDEFGKEISDVLAQPGENFPFEYYAIKFATFADQPYSGYSKHIRHLLIDSSQINHEYATREYTKSMYSAHASAPQKYKFQNEYRKHKTQFRTDILAEINDTLSDYKFTVRNNSKSNLETDLVITEGDIPIENKGRGKQCLIKTEFALKKNAGTYTLDAILLEEPENHLSHLNTKKLIQSIRESKTKQVFLATHSSLICTRLDLRKVVMLNSSSGSPLLLNGLSPDTADFFMKAPDNNVLEFILSKKVILVEGDAEFILMETFYKKVASERTPEQDDVHVISVGGTSFKRYIELAKALKIRTAIIRDNDGDHQKNCVDSYSEFSGMGHVKVFADPVNSRSTFEICMYAENTAACNELFGPGRKTLPVLDYMLKNKADAAFELLAKKAVDLVTPPYIQEAIEWIRA